MDLSNLSAENKQLALQLMEMGRTDDAMKLIQAYSGPRVGRGDLGERGELLARGRDIGLDQEDLFVPPQSSFQKFTADLNYGLLQQGNALDQMFSRVTGNDKNAAAADQRVYDMQQSYQESGLADEVTGGRATAAILPSLTGAGVLRNLLMQAPIKTGAAMGATEMMLEPVVDDPNFWTAKAKQAAEGAAWGTGGEVIPRAGIRAVEEAFGQAGSSYRVLHGEAINRPLARGSAADQAAMRETRDITNIDFTPGQMTDSKALKMGEELARSGLLTMNRVEAGDMVRAGQYDKYIQEYRDSLGPNAPIETVAPKMQAFGRERSDIMRQERRSQADIDYRPITEFEGGRPVVPADNYTAALEDIIERGESAGASKDAVSAATEARGRLDRLEEQGGMLTGRDVEQLVRANPNYTGSSFGAGAPAYDVRLAKDIRKAVELDIEDIPGLVDPLANAKANYKRASGHIDEFENTLFGKVVGEEFESVVDGLKKGTVTPEKVMSTFTKASPTQINATFAHLNKFDPGLANEIRGSILERARQASMVRPSAAGVDDTLDPAAFLRALGVTGGERGLVGLERLEALFPDNPEALRALLRAGRILGDKQLRNTSGTATSTAAREMLSTATALVTGAWNRIAGSVGGALPMQVIASTMDPKNVRRGPPQPLNLGKARRVHSGVRPGYQASTGAIHGETDQ